jgi:hypothetical protein
LCHFHRAVTHAGLQQVKSLHDPKKQCHEGRKKPYMFKALINLLIIVGIPRQRKPLSQLTLVTSGSTAIMNTYGPKNQNH